MTDDERKRLEEITRDVAVCPDPDIRWLVALAEREAKRAAENFWNVEASLKAERDARKERDAAIRERDGWKEITEDSSLKLTNEMLDMKRERDEARRTESGALREMVEEAQHRALAEAQAAAMRAALEKYLPLIEGRMALPHGLSSRDAKAALQSDAGAAVMEVVRAASELDVRAEQWRLRPNDQTLIDMYDAVDANHAALVTLRERGIAL